jgi:hypothetical protein
MKKSRQLIRALFASSLAFVGGAFGVFGELDDAPGLILLGIILFFFSVYTTIKLYSK